MTKSKRPQKGRIFISYRRIDTSYAAGRIYDRLVEHYGEDAIFMDVDTIEGGVDFIKVLEDAVQSCDVLIALIGKQWLTVKDNGGKPRLDNPEDFVRIEIATALKRNIRVIPVLVDGVDMPLPTELPENLKALARRNALQVNHHSFNPDVYRLIEHSESALEDAEESRVRKAQAPRVARDKAAKAAAINKALSKILPFLRNLGIIGIVVLMLWGGSLVIPKFIALIPTAKVSLTPTKVAASTSTSLTTEIADAKGVQMMLVPAGEFTMGKDDGLSDERPSHIVYLDAFYMDKKEVTNSLYKVCVADGACLRPLHTNLYYASARANYPVVTVDWSMANAYCQWRGGSLPTEAQWEKAARGEEERTYPWGELTPALQYANYNGSDAKDVGTYLFVRSPYDVLDLAGNVSEWVSDWYSPEYYQTVFQDNILNPGGPIAPPYQPSHNYYGRVFRGGSWRTTNIAELSTTYRFRKDPALYADDLGFRCVEDAP